MFQKLYDIIYWLDCSIWGAWGWPTIILILGTGILLTVMLKGFQFRKLGEAINSTIMPTIKGFFKKGKDKAASKAANSITAFEAFSAAISGTIGTGNIVGVSYALLNGGPGAIFWMWISALLGMLTKYTESVLGMYFRKREKNGEFSGGAMYYITAGLKAHWLGVIAAVLTVVAAIGMSAVQTNKISSTIVNAINPSENVGNILTIVIAVIVAALIALVIIGGIKRISKVASVLVPFMSILYLVLGLIVIVVHCNKLPWVFGQIFSRAFTPKAALGGIFGYTLSVVIRNGMKRGIFSNEAGLGSSVIAHAASDEKEPVKQGLWGIFEVFFDTIIICTMTALIILTTVDTSVLTAASSDTGTALLAMQSNFGGFGTIAFAVILPLFAFTTAISWEYYGEKALDFITESNEKVQKVVVFIFKLVYVVLVIGATFITGDFVWNVSDVANALMAIPNLIAVVCLSGLVVKITKNYYARKAGEKVAPMLNYDEELNAEFAEELKKN